MIRRDYILRLIEQAGPFLKKVFGFRQAKKLDDAQATLRQACGDLLAVDLQLLLAMSAEGLRQLLSIDEGTAMGRCLVAAALLAEQAQVFEAQGRPDEAKECRSKAAELFSWIASLPGGKEALEGSEEFRRSLERLNG